MRVTFEQRQTLAADWNATVNAGCRITLRQFAAKHGLRYETWRREYMRGATGTAVLLVLVDRRSRRYVIEKLEHIAQDDVIAALKSVFAESREHWPGQFPTMRRQDGGVPSQAVQVIICSSYGRNSNIGIQAGPDSQCLCCHGS